MCGIAGIFAYRESAPPVDEQELLRIREAMVKRGPDGAGLWVSDDGRIGLAHRRLAIIDLTDGGAQPMETADGRLRITFNGEIYNYRELRKELEAKGCRFHSASDTEVLLHLYADRGEEMVHTLRGMYAFGIWDARKKSLFLARDPFGIKPLYYAEDGKTFRFASQVKALLKGGRIDTAPQPAGWVGFGIWGAVPEPYTLYRQINLLPAGSWLRVRSGRMEVPHTYFSINEEFVKAQETALTQPSQEQSEILGNALRDSIKHHLVSDVPVGIFLSAGLDSGLLTGLAAETSVARLHTLTVGFREYQGTENDEVPLAEIVSARYGTRHDTHWITRDDFEQDLDSILAAMDQPTTDGINTYLVSKAASRAGIKVALSGLGGDELFGGYPSFSQVPRLAEWLPFGRPGILAGALLRRLVAPLMGKTVSPKLAGALEYSGSYSRAYLLRRALFAPWELGQMLDTATIEAGLHELQPLARLDATVRNLRGRRQRVSALELEWYMRNQLLRDADWAGMAHSLEIRVPFVDVGLFRALAPFLVSKNPPRKQDATSVLHNTLPQASIARRKTGFITPVREWAGGTTGKGRLERGLRGWAKRVVPSPPRMFRALVLLSDGFGGKGGIAKFNRDLLSALCSMPECSKVVALPRLCEGPVEALPPKLLFETKASNGKLCYLYHVIGTILRHRFDLIVVGHINLTVLGSMARAFLRIPMLLVIHGIDAWQPHENAAVRLSLKYFTGVISVSRVTLERFISWSGINPARVHLLPNCVELDRYGLGPKSGELARRLGVEGNTILMTVGRLSTVERYKGFDEIIEVVSDVAEKIPSLVYLICGEGPDRERLQNKANALGVGSRVLFAGFIPEEQKADYYRLADAYVMPSRGEGFGIVFLEAMACGIPVLGSRVDGSREALMDGKLGLLVNPSDRNELISGIVQTLARPRGVPSELKEFSFETYKVSASNIIRRAVGLPAPE